MVIYNHERWISGKHRPNHNKESYAYEQWISGKYHANFTSFITVSFRRSSRTPPPSCLMSRPIFRERILCGPPLSCLSDVQIRFSYASKSKLSGLCLNDPPHVKITTIFIQDEYKIYTQDEYTTQQMNQPSSYEENSTYNKWTPFVEQRRDDRGPTPRRCNTTTCNSTEM